MKYQASELFFSLHPVSVIGEDECSTIVTLCPSAHWDAKQCLPVGYFDIEHLQPVGYTLITSRSETVWVTKNSPEKVRAELTSAGFIENKALEQFLTKCWR